MTARSAGRPSAVVHPAVKMTTVTEFPRRVREIENIWIELADGCRLAARVWLPEDAEASPVPAVLEYLPYPQARPYRRTRRVDARLFRRPRLRFGAR